MSLFFISCFFRKPVRVFLISFCLLFFISFSWGGEEERCAGEFSPVSVFVNFAKDNLGESYSSHLGPEWEGKLRSALKSRSTLKSWSSIDETEFFLLYLHDRIGLEETVKRIKAVSYFRFSGYEKFFDTVDFYESYIGGKKGEELVTLRLKRSLGGFFYKGSLENLEEVVKYIEGYIGKEEVKESMKKDLQGFSKANFKELKRVVEYIEGYIGREEVKERMKKDLRGFSSANPEKLKEVVEYIEGYIGREEVKERMKKNLQGFSGANPEKLKEVVEYIEGYIGREEMKERK